MKLRRRDFQRGLDSMSDAQHVKMAVQIRRDLAQENIRQEMRLVYENERIIEKLEKLLASERDDPEGMPASVEADIEEIRQQIGYSRQRIEYQKTLLNDQHYLITGEEPE